MYLSSLASFTYPNTDGTAIACCNCYGIYAFAKIAKITNTTMISTNVKPFLLDFFCNFFNKSFIISFFLLPCLDI